MLLLKKSRQASLCAPKANSKSSWLASGQPNVFETPNAPRRGMRLSIAAAEATVAPVTARSMEVSCMVEGTVSRVVLLVTICVTQVSMRCDGCRDGAGADVTFTDPDEALRLI